MSTTLYTATSRRRTLISAVLQPVIYLGLTAMFLLFAQFIDTGLVRWLWWAAGAGLIAALIRAGDDYLGLVSARQEENPLREKLLRASWRSNKEPSGHQVSTLTDGVERMTTYRHTFLGKLWGVTAAPLIVVLALAIWVDWVAALVLACIIPFIPLTIWGFLSKAKKPSTASRRARAALAAKYLEVIQGLDTIVMLGAGQRVERELEELGEKNRVAAMGILRWNQLELLISDGAFSLGAVTASALLAGWRADSAGEAVALIGLAVVLLGPLDTVGSSLYVGMSGRTSQAAARAILSTGTASSPDIDGQSTKDARVTDVPGGPLIRLRDVAVGYGDTDSAVLTDVSLDIYSGDFIAIVGPSGAGKSTLLATIGGELPPLAGEVTTRRAVAAVHQTTWLFTGTIRDNLQLVSPDADDEQLWEVLRMVRLDRFVLASPGGLDQPVGERGLAISGGQAQRLALARAILSGREIIILDEPTAHIDAESHAAIESALDDLRGTRTIIMITHKTPPAFARIISVRDGRVYPSMEEAL